MIIKAFLIFSFKCYLFIVFKQSTQPLLFLDLCYIFPASAGINNVNKVKTQAKKTTKKKHKNKKEVVRGHSHIDFGFR